MLFIKEKTAGVKTQYDFKESISIKKIGNPLNPVSRTLQYGAQVIVKQTNHCFILVLLLQQLLDHLRLLLLFSYTLVL